MKKLKVLSVSILFLVLVFPMRIRAQEELLELAEKYRKEGKYNLALDVLKGLRETHREGSIFNRALVIEGDILRDIGDTIGAVKKYRSVLEFEPGDSLAYVVSKRLVELSTSYKERGNILLDFASSYPLSAFSDTSLKECLAHFEKAGFKKGELKAYKLLSFLHPEERRRYLLQIARLWGEVGRPERGLKLLKRFGNDSDSLHLYRGLIFLSQGDTGRAIIEFTKCLSPDCKAKLFDLYLSARMVARAESLITKLPSDSFIGDRLLRLYLLKDDTSRLREIIQSNKVKDPRLLAEAYLILGKYEKAEELLRGVDSCSALLAETLEKEGKYIEAYRILKGCKKVEFPRLRFELAERFLRMGLPHLVFPLIEGFNIYPRDKQDRLLYSAYLFVGENKKADSLACLMRKRGFYVSPVYPTDSILSIFTNLSDSSRYKIGCVLLNMGAYEDIISLFLNKRLVVKEAVLLGNALTRLFLVTGDTGFAKKALQIYSRMDRKPPSYYLLMYHLRPQDAVVKNFRLEEFDEDEKRALIYILSLKGKKDLALNMVSTLRDRERGLFELFLGVNMLDSAFKYLDTENYYDIFRLAKKYYMKGAMDEALGLLSYIPDDLSCISLKAREIEADIYYSRGEYKKFIKVGNKILPYLKGSLLEEFKRKLAISYFKNGEYGRALYLTWDLKDSISLKLKAHSLLELGEIEMASSIPESDPSVKMEILLRSHRLQEALRLYPPRTKKEAILFVERFLESPLIDTLPFILKGLAKKKLLDPFDVYLYLLEYELRKDSLDKALFYLGKLDGEPKKQASFEIGLYFMKKGDNDRAKTYFYRAFESKSDEVRGRAAFKLASILFAEGRYEDAAEFYRIASNLLSGKERVKALYNMAVTLKRAGLEDSAIALFKEIVEKWQGSDESDDASITLALLYEDMGKWDSAISYLHELMGEMASSFEEAERAYWEAEAYVNKNRLKDALRLYSIIFERYTGSGDWGVTAGLKAAKIQSLLNNKDKAVRILRRIVKLRGEADPLGKVALEELQKLKG